MDMEALEEPDGDDEAMEVPEDEDPNQWFPNRSCDEESCVHWCGPFYEGEEALSEMWDTIHWNGMWMLKAKYGEGGLEGGFYDCREFHNYDAPGWKDGEPEKPEKESQPKL